MSFFKNFVPSSPKKKIKDPVNKISLSKEVTLYNSQGEVSENQVLPARGKLLESKIRRLFLKFLLLTPPAFLLRINYKSPFQNLNVDILFNEVYGHTITSGSSNCSIYSGGHWHDPWGTCISWDGEGNCKAWRCSDQAP